MPSFTVEAVQGSRTWTHPQGGENIDYTINVSGGEAMQGEAVTVTRKPESKAPQVGDVLENHELLAKKGQHPRKLKAMPQAGGGGNRSGGSSKSGDYRSPEQIMRGWAHSHALTYWERKHAADPAFAFGSWEAYLAIVDLFYADVVGAKKAAEA